MSSNSGAAYTRSTASLSATVRAKTHSSCSMLFMGMAFHDAEAFERPPATARADAVVRHTRPLVAECGIRWEPEPTEIGRASGRERVRQLVEFSVVAVLLTKKNQ